MPSSRVLDFAAVRSPLHYQTPLGRLLRWPLGLLKPGTVVPILSGPNRGFRWIVGASTHGAWLGTYERRTQGQLVDALRPGDVAYDIGANAGFFTLLMARRVGPTGHVHAFEPMPENLAFLREHLTLNRLTNVTVHPVAVSDVTGTVAFTRGVNLATGSIEATGDLTVPCVALDDLQLPLPRAIKMDIEGAESLALCGMTRTLREARPLLVIEGHIPP